MTIADLIGWLLIETGLLTIAIALTVRDRQVIVTE